MNRCLEELKKQYTQVPIPDELDFLVKKAIKRRRNSRPLYIKFMAGVSAAAILLIAGLNTSPAFAHTLSEIPVVNSIVKVLTFRDWQIDNGKAQATVEVPAITNMDNTSLEETLNNKYLEESIKLYNEFIIEMEKLNQAGGGHLGVNSGYVVQTDDDRILSLGRYVVNTVGSSSTTYKYDTIDKKDQLLITLPSLFKDNQYIDLISENVKEQMKEQMEIDPSKFYWVDGIENKMEKLNFKAIDKEHTFYINKDRKLVIVFNKYEVAPGYMGVLEFVIPTDVIAHDLVSNEYIN